MSKTQAPRIAILGAGPIGLEAGLAAQALKLPFTIYERGRVGEHVRRWGHVKLFSPFGMNATPLGRQAIRHHDPRHEFPDDDACITGREHVDVYLAPLAEQIKDQIKTETQVLRIGRKGLLKHEAAGEPARGRQPFLLLMREKQIDRIEEADIVLDCTGTFAQHRWLGQAGIPALGELQLENQISYHLDDLLGDRKKDFVNKSILVVGSGHSAAATVCNLAQLAEEHNTTWVTWLARSPHSQPLRRLMNDPLRERDRLASRANTLATRDDDNVEYHPGTLVEAIESLGQDKGYRVTARSSGQPKIFEVEKIIANVGYTPDTMLYRELQIHECFSTLAPMKLATAMAASKGSDCMKQVGYGPESLRNPEPNFYILGMKSYGRGSSFLLRVGFDQVRDVFTLITGKANPELAPKK